MKSVSIFACLLGITFSGYAQQKKPTTLKEKTAFQTSTAWMPEIDVRSDIAIVYGTNDRPGVTFEQRVQSWRDHGYQTHFMTGMAWGEYPDYFQGGWDGKNHMESSQIMMNGDTVWHDQDKGMPYVVPVQSFIDYLKTAVVKRVIDAGISSIYLEEPEFWARSGYSKPFKEAWQKYYGFPWRPQDASAENTYLSSKLKYHLFYDAIAQVSSYAKSYGKSKGLNIKVYIATHSLVNYSAWEIVSPEASLASLPGIDGYIAQVWTGTSRVATHFNGLKKERVFENAFLEYGSTVSMTAPTGRKMFLLTDPIEDQPRDWSDFKRNYEATFTAKLMYPMVANYEVMPWPERIYTRPFKIANNNIEVLIPNFYSTQMQVMVNALNQMPLSANCVSGTNGIGVLMSNTLMFQRFPTHNGFEDPNFSNFYGQTMPLVKNGVPVQTVHMENLSYAATLKDIKVLVVSYTNMKPLSQSVHKYLAAWVKKGGILIYCGEDNDPYQSVAEWWNQKGKKYTAPSQDLFALLKIKPSEPGTAQATPQIAAKAAEIASGQKYPVGKGAVYVIRENPKEFVLQANNDSNYLKIVKQAFEKDARAGNLVFKNNFYLERGAYEMISVFDENTDQQPYVVKGPVIDLFDPQLPVLAEKIIKPGENAFLFNPAKVSAPDKPQVLASASRVSDEESTKNTYTFIAKSPAKTLNSMRVLLPAVPKEIMISDSKGNQLIEVTTSWDAASKTVYLGFGNSPEGVKVSLRW